MDVKTVAGEVVTIDEAFLKALPFISGMIGFVPGGAVAAPFMPLVGEVLVALDNAAKAVASGDNAGAAGSVLDAIKRHLTPGEPNAPALG